MVLSDSKIADELSYGDLEIEPLDLDIQLQPTSLDVRLGNSFIEYSPPVHDVLDVTDDQHQTYGKEFEANGGVAIEQGNFYLGETIERFYIPDHLIAHLEGRSSIGRLGIEIHSTAGLVDPEFEGQITLEITNKNPFPVRLYPNMRIGQVTFTEVNGRVSNPYNEERNKYQGQTGPTKSRIHEDG